MAASRVISTALRGQRLDIEYGILRAASSRPGRLCLMLPSSGTHFKMFQPLAELAKSDRKTTTMVGVNFFSTSKSTRPESLTLDNAELTFQAEAILEVAEQISPDASVALVGHSYGGAVAIKAAERFASLGRPIESLCLFEANATYLLPEEHGGERPISTEWSAMLDAGKRGDEAGAETMAKRVTEFWNSEIRWDSLPPDARSKIKSALQRSLAFELHTLFNETRNGLELLRFLKELSASKHFIHGTVGTAPMINDLAALLEQEAGFMRHSMAGVDHMGPITSYESVAKLIAECARL